MRTVLASIAFVGLVNAQVATNPTQTTGAPAVENAGNPLFKVTVVSRTTKAVNYRFRGGETNVDFQGTAISPKTSGRARVEGKSGYVQVEARFEKLQPPAGFGPEFLTYVLWGISPEGRAKNLGEIVIDSDGKAKVDVTTELQTFGMIITAEPYFAVTQPSDVIVAENFVRPDTEGRIQFVDAKYELLKRGSYEFRPNQSAVKKQASNELRDLNLMQARNAVQIARWTGADKYAADTFQKAEAMLKQAEDYHVRKQWKPVSTVAREAAQVSEDARILTLQRQEEERLAAERKASADREAEQLARANEAKKQQDIAQQNAQMETLRRAEADKARLSAETERLAAERAKLQADVARAAAEKANAEAQAQQQASAAQAAQARAAAEQSEKARLNAEMEKQQLRDQIRQQLNMILETRETARGLVVNMSDVLFDTGKYTLRPAAREKLARVSGIILGHPGLQLEVEGHTDSVGSEAYNQTLSERRASGVRDYLTGQGLQNVAARGFGKMQPVATNDTAAGRQQNRRVELVVSGDIIGTRTTTSTTIVPSQTPLP